MNERKRYIITQRGEFLGSVFADCFVEVNGTDTGHFYIGPSIVGSVELTRVEVSDSGGRMQETPGQLESQARFASERLMQAYREHHASKVA